LFEFQFNGDNIMFSDPFQAPKDVSSGSAITEPFTLVSLANNSSIRVNVDAADGEPKVMKVSHTDVGKGTLARTRHLFRFESFVVEDSVENLAKPIAFYAVFDIPKTGASSAQLLELYEQFVGALRGGSGDVVYDGDATVCFNRILNGES
jgi:hypothetical protein